MTLSRNPAVAAAALFAVLCSIAGGYLVVVAAESAATLEHQQSLLIATIAFIVCVIPILRRLLSGAFDPFEPIVLAATMLALLCGVRPIVTIFAQEYVLVDRFSIEPYFDRAVLLGAIGAISFVFAYELALTLMHARHEEHGHAQPQRPRISIAPGDAFRYSIVISGMGILLYSVYVRQAGGIGELAKSRSVELVQRLGSTSEYFSAAPIALACAATLMVVARKGRMTLANKLQVATFAIMPALAFGLLGNRRFIIPCLLLPVIVAYLSSGRRPKTAVIVALGALAFIVLATIPYARTQGARQQSGGVSAIYSEAFAQPALVTERFVLGEDTAMIPYLSLQIRYQDEHGYYYWGRATLGDFLIAPIPSSVFPNKPLSARDDLLTRLFGDRCRYTGGGLCPDFSAIGTFYQDFAVPGVIGGMVLLGVLGAAIWRRFLNDPESPYRVVIAAAATIFLPIMLRAGTMPAFAWALYFVIPISIGIRVSRVRLAR